jgi:hypothetical protein
MKRFGAFVVLIAVLVLSLLLGACQASPQAAPPSESATAAAAPTADTSQASQAPDMSPSPSVVSPSPATTTDASPSPAATTAAPDPSQTPDAAFLFEETAYEDGGISINYPQITGYSDTTVRDALNQLIADSALREVPTIKGDASLDVYEMVYTVSLNTPEVISVYFDGYASYKQAAHPYQFFYSVTIDVKKLQTVTLAQLVTMSPDFLALLPDGAFRSVGIDVTDEYTSIIKDWLRGEDADFMLQQFRDADTPGHDTSSYLTKDSLGISIVIGHAMGDHIEILLKFSDLHGFQTDNLLWKDIEK